LRRYGRIGSESGSLEADKTDAELAARLIVKVRTWAFTLQTYEREQTAEQPLVTFYKGQTNAFETSPLAVTEGMNAKSKAVPMRFGVPLSQLPQGEYNCQVTMLDPNGNNKAALWRAPVRLIPEGLRDWRLSADACEPRGGSIRYPA
jgi:hypothetical protein